MFCHTNSLLMGQSALPEQAQGAPLGCFKICCGDAFGPPLPAWR
jgi:hypothetical protein